MLVLSRKKTEKIMIGKDVVVTVARIHGNRVQLAISAPQDIRIRRAELPPVGNDGHLPPPPDAEPTVAPRIPGEPIDA